jgi:hypothetical protein
MKLKPILALLIQNASKPKALLAVSILWLLISAQTLSAQTTYYMTTGATNPQSASITYLDLTTTAGSSSNGLFTESNTTRLDYAAEGAAGTYNYFIVPGINMASPEASTAVVTTSTGYGWESPATLTCDIGAGTWTFSNRFEGQIGAGSPALYVEVSVYAYNGTTSTLLFNYTDTTDISGSLSFSPFTYSFTTNQGTFPGTTGQNLKVEYYTQFVGGGPYAGGFVYLGYNTSSDFVTVPVCPPPTNTATNTPTATTTNTSTNTATNTPTNTSTDSSTNTPTDTATSTCTNSVTNTATNTPTNTSTNSSTDTPTNTVTNTSTDTVINTPTNTSTNTATATVTNTTTSTSTYTSTNTPLNSNTPTNTSTNTATNTNTNTSTNTATYTATNTSTNTSTNTVTNTVTSTATNTFTITPVNTFTSTLTATNTFTPTLTNTPSVSPTPSNTATVTPNIHGPVAIYPNPYAGDGPMNLQVPLAVPGNVKVSIFTLAFRKVQETQFYNLTPGTNVTFNVIDKNGVSLANGLYYVRIEYPSGQTILKLLILR